MSKTTSDDPRSIRSRQDLQNALKELLQTKLYPNISITDITQKAGYTRHTFYNHFDTKEDLLNSVVDSLLDKLFMEAGHWENLSGDLESENKFGYKFFQIWEDQEEIIKTLSPMVIDCLLIDRLKIHFMKYYYESNDPQISGANLDMADYVSTLNAYAFVGVLRKWINDGMKYPPEFMGQFILHFLGIKHKISAIDKFNGTFLKFSENKR
jgi:AcrR family transcriptional regulator